MSDGDMDFWTSVYTVGMEVDVRGYEVPWTACVVTVVRPAELHVRFGLESKLRGRPVDPAVRILVTNPAHVRPRNA